MNRTQVTNAIKRLAKESGATYQQLFTKLVIERAAARLTRDKLLRDCLVFKGGFVSVSLYKSPRFTTDLDAVLYGKSIDVVLEKIREAMATELEDGVWFEFERIVDLKTQSEYGGTRLQFRAGIVPRPKNITKTQILDIDIGTGDPITPAPVESETESMVGAEPISWKVYPVETIIAEKLHPLVTLGSENSRSKDIFDLYLLLPKANPNVLVTALQRTFSYRQTPLPDKFSRHLSKLDTQLLRKGWKAAIGTISKLEFNDAYEKVIELLESHDL